MSEVKQGLYYSKEHEWVEKVDSNKVRIGITDFAQHQLGDIVFVEFPAVGDEVTSGTSVGSVESVKTVSDIYSPVSGKVTAVNEQLEDSPELVNSSPYGDGWMIEVEVADLEEAVKELLTEEDYKTFIAEDE
ncbi:glycine cleavage system protein GcvH [Paenibacillus senegalensis]|uniref:glycine cleavage system protein GcvH n=1 Tax=Paenibacillus senegalensis TaxID=1465766 RepID=UPI000289CD34|nr:glycine cleavage system protein GcvH [Paenibacillus senegalensis]